MTKWKWSPYDLIPVGELQELAFECAQKMCKQLGCAIFDRSATLGTVMQEVLCNAELIGSTSFTDFLPFEISSTSPADHKRTMEARVIGNEIILISRGGVHYYEVYDQLKATFLMWVMHAAKVREIILTQAAGALNPDFNVKDFVFHNGVYRNEHPDSFLRIIPDDKMHFFKDPSKPFSNKLQERLTDIAKQNNIPTQSGTLSMITGPTFEDKGQRLALVRVADIAGMSTGNEIVTAHILEMSGGAIGVMTDECKPDCIIEQADIKKVSQETQAPMDRLLTTYYEDPLPIDR